MRGKQSTPSSCTSTVEITKKQLVQLAKTDMTTQAINLEYNESNKFLLPEMKQAEQKVSTSTGSNYVNILAAIHSLIAGNACMLNCK